MIKRTITYKDLRIMLNLYKTLVRPHVEYCVSAWSPYYKKDKELLEKVDCKGFSRIRPEELFQFDDRGKGTRGHSLLN